VAAGGAPGVVGLVSGHPVAGIVLLVLCEAVVGFGIFAGGIIRDTIGPWRMSITDWLQKVLGRAVSRFDRRYRDHILNDLKFMESKGVPTRGFFAPKLTDVYVDLSLAHRAPHLVPSDLLAELPPDVTERHRIERFLDQSDTAVLAILGGPGSGKTTLLRYTARKHCERERGKRYRVPILLSLRDHVSAIVQNPSVSLVTLARQSLTPFNLNDTSGWFELRLSTGRCLVLLDGLDEVAQPEDRHKVAGWVDTQISRYAKNSFVITSRRQGFESGPIERATVLVVRSFSDEQVRKFVNGWYLSLERELRGDHDPDAPRRASQQATDLLDRLKSNPALRELAVNPLLLTMMANVHRFLGALPGSRADLYRDICQATLWRRQDAKDLSSELRGEQKEKLLRRLAFTMMDRGVRDLPRSELLATIRPGLRRLSSELDVASFLADVESNGLLVERETSLYSFAHQTFQEYLAAAYILDRNLVKVLADKVHDSWWRETTLLYAARAEADEIVEACLRSATVTALSLAFDCVDQKAELAPELRTEVEGLLATELSADTEPGRRRLMAGVLATRHLRRFTTPVGGIHMCTRPVTRRIYRLFLQDNGLPGMNGPAPANEDEVATGVWGVDALAFTQWLNQVTESQTPYRLLKRAEIDNIDVRRTLDEELPDLAGYHVWLEPGDGVALPDIWTASDFDQPYQIEGQALEEVISEDIRGAMPTLFRLFLTRTILEAQSLVDKLEKSLDRAKESLGKDAPQREVDRVMVGARSLIADEGSRLANSVRPAEKVAATLGLRTEFGVTLEATRAVMLPAHHRARVIEHANALRPSLAAGLDPTLADAVAVGRTTIVTSDRIMGTALSRPCFKGHSHSLIAATVTVAL
jgi:hypothetical protein